MLDPAWQPRWVREDRGPRFHSSTTHGELPGSDCLQLSYNETEQGAIDRDFKLCFAASGDIRNLVQTINKLPRAYHGKCDILLNDTDSIVVNRNLVVLYALLGPGPSIEESAEIAVHLMYSSALRPAIAAYLRGCVRVIYGDGANEGDMSFRCTMRTRGQGKLFSMQSTMAMRRPIEMLLSSYELRKGQQSMRKIVTDPKWVDDQDRVFANLQPTHRIALTHFRQTGVLAPFSFSTREFTQPNRLMYTAAGEWLGDAKLNPLKGWNVSDVQASGAKYGVGPADILGCLFFHVKKEFMEFAARMKEFHVDLHLTQFSPQLLSKGISIGALPAFTEGCFDRVETLDLADSYDIPDLLDDWGPMLNRNNRRACILMQTRRWHKDQPSATAQSNPCSAVMLVERCKDIPSLKAKLEGALSQGTKSPALMRLVESLDAFIDHERAFREFLAIGQVEVAAKDLGLRIRRCNRINPKRYGVPIDAPQQKLPNLSRDEYYSLFMIGGADLLTRFLEFERASQ